MSAAADFLAHRAESDLAALATDAEAVSDARRGLLEEACRRFLAECDRVRAVEAELERAGVGLPEDMHLRWDPRRAVACDCEMNTDHPAYAQPDPKEHL